MSALVDLKIYLGTTLAGDYDDVVLSSVLDAEIDAQNARVRVGHQLTDPLTWDAHPASLREALLRHCARNLAMRRIPLGIVESDVYSLRVSANDSEIKRLEAPFRRLAVG